jgi:hypothetical protein
LEARQQRAIIWALLSQYGHREDCPAFRYETFFSMGDVGELMVLFAAVICLVVTMLEREGRLEN